jgi:hypothetical protein
MDLFGISIVHIIRGKPKYHVTMLCLLTPFCYRSELLQQSDSKFPIKHLSDGVANLTPLIDSSPDLIYPVATCRSHHSSPS